MPTMFDFIRMAEKVTQSPMDEFTSKHHPPLDKYSKDHLTQGSLNHSVYDDRSEHGCAKGAALADLDLAATL